MSYLHLLTQTFQTYLVSGGSAYVDGVYTYLSSTELLREGSRAWVATGQLPGQPRGFLRGVSLDNRVLMTGKDPRHQYWDHDYSISGGYHAFGRSGRPVDDIVEFDPKTGQWKEVGKMLEKRYGHAMAVVDWDDVKQYCE